MACRKVKQERIKDWLPSLWVRHIGKNDCCLLRKEIQEEEQEKSGSRIWIEDERLSLHWDRKEARKSGHPSS